MKSKTVSKISLLVMLLAMLGCSGGSSGSATEEKTIKLSVKKILGESTFLYGAEDLYVAIQEADKDQMDKFEILENDKDWGELTKVELEELKDALTMFDTIVLGIVAKEKFSLTDTEIVLTGEFADEKYYAPTMFVDLNKNGIYDKGDIDFSFDIENADDPIKGKDLPEEYSGTLDIEEEEGFVVGDAVADNTFDQIDTLIKNIENSDDSGEENNGNYTGGALPYYNKGFEETFYASIDVANIHLEQNYDMSFSMFMLNVAFSNPAFEALMADHKKITDTTWEGALGAQFENVDYSKLTKYEDSVYDISLETMTYETSSKESIKYGFKRSAIYDPVNDKYFSKATEIKEEGVTDRITIHEFKPYGNGYLLRIAEMKNINEVENTGEVIEILYYMTKTSCEAVKRASTGVFPEEKVLFNTDKTWEAYKSAIVATEEASWNTEEFSYNNYQEETY